MTENRRIEAKIDWLGMSSPSFGKVEFPTNFGTEHLPIAPLRGYQFAMQFVEDNRIVAQSTVIGTYVQYSGKTLNIAKLDALSIARFHHDRGFKPTRIDIAIDAHNTGLSITSLYRAFQLDECETKSKKCSITENNEGGKTLYIGSRTSEGFMRVYDKGIESGSGGDWIRIELELKGEKAITAMLAMFNAKDVSAWITGAIKGFANFTTNKNWLGIMASEKVLIKSDKQKGGDTRAWLLSQVIHSLVKTYKQGDREIIQDFMSELAEKLKDAKIE